MSREMLFRAYDHFNACYYYSENYKSLSEFFQFCEHCIEGGNKITYEQYIGIGDKNKTKVFEGDIATCYILFPSIFHDDGETTEARIVQCDFEVVYTLGEYVLKPFDEKHPTLGMWDFTNDEVDEQYFLDILSFSNDIFYTPGEEEREYLNSLLKDLDITLDQLIKGSNLIVTGNIHKQRDE